MSGINLGVTQVICGQCAPGGNDFGIISLFSEKPEGIGASVATLLAPADESMVNLCQEQVGPRPRRAGLRQRPEDFRRSAISKMLEALTRPACR